MRCYFADSVLRISWWTVRPVPGITMLTNKLTIANPSKLARKPQIKPLLASKKLFYRRLREESGIPRGYRNALGCGSDVYCGGPLGSFLEVSSSFRSLSLSLLSQVSPSNQSPQAEAPPLHPASTLQFHPVWWSDLNGGWHDWHRHFICTFGARGSSWFLQVVPNTPQTHLHHCPYHIISKWLLTYPLSYPALNAADMLYWYLCFHKLQQCWAGVNAPKPWAQKWTLLPSIHYALWKAAWRWEKGKDLKSDRPGSVIQLLYACGSFLLTHFTELRGFNDIITE